MKATAQHEAEILQHHLDGTVLLYGDPGYDEARSVWNAMIDRRPAAIVRCRSESDVIHAIAFAREHDLRLSVRGGGHHIAGHAVCDNGVMIDLSGLRAVRVNAPAWRASVEPGATLRDVDAATQLHGLATPLGINSTTGVAGLTLGGGFGWTTRKYGVTVDNLVGARLVTAGGQVLETSLTSHPDLFWALRGGGGNFGVVTRFDFALHPVGPAVLSGLIVYPLEQAGTVLRKYREFAATAPDDLSVWVVLRQAPPLPFLAPEFHGRNVLVFALCHLGDSEQGLKLIAPLSGYGDVCGERIGVQPFVEWQQAFDPLLAPGARNYWKSHNFSSLKDGYFDLLVEFAGRLPSPQCEIFLGQLGGQAGRIAPDATAYPNRDANFVMNVHARWTSPADDRTCIEWARELFRASTPFATGGAYVNFLTADETDRVPYAFGRNYHRLLAVKQRYDPRNIFRQNPNLRPIET